MQIGDKRYSFEEIRKFYETTGRIRRLIIESQIESPLCGRDESNRDFYVNLCKGFLDQLRQAKELYKKIPEPLEKICQEIPIHIRESEGRIKELLENL